MTYQKETPTEFVAKVSVKLQDFWTEDPDLWFLHAEAAFRNAQITQSKTKFDHIVQKLPQKIMVSVRGLIMGSAASRQSITWYGCCTTPVCRVHERLIQPWISHVSVVYSEPIEIVWRYNIYLSIYIIIQSELWTLQSALLVNGNIYFYWNYRLTWNTVPVPLN